MGVDLSTCSQTNDRLESSERSFRSVLAEEATMARQAGPTAAPADTPASTPRPAALPPGPRLPVLVQTLLWGLWPVRFFETCDRRWGATFTTRIVGGQTTVTISDPGAIKMLFGLRADDFRANEGAGVILEPFLGPHSLLLLDGEEHQRERR